MEIVKSIVVPGQARELRGAVNLRRIEIGPVAVLAGSLLLLVSLFLDWYELEPGAGFTAFHRVRGPRPRAPAALALVGVAGASLGAC